jgi:type IV pilus assembly protein PilM
MPSIFSKGSKGVGKGFAGLALHGDSLRYIELKGDLGSLQVLRREKVPLDRGVIVKDMVVDWMGLAASMKTLKTTVKNFRFPVNVGIPSRDVILRLVEYPKMPLEDVKEALQLEFDKYFPYAYQDAAADIAEVNVPNAFEDGGKTTVLVATCKQYVVADLMKMAGSAGMNVTAVEPMNVAFFRAVTGPLGLEGGYFVVFVEPESTQIMLGYKDNGILFRSSSVDMSTAEFQESEDGAMPILRDVQNTVIFAGNQYKGLMVDNIVLGGVVGKNSRLGTLLESTTSMPVAYPDISNIWGVTSSVGGADGFDSAFGLAVRHLL